MERKYTNTDCQLYGSYHCALLHMESCESCTVGTASAEEAESLKRKLDVTDSLMPAGGVSCLFTSQECLLCKGEEKGARACYANTDIGHVEPKTPARNAIGIKITARTGSLVPLQIACCAQCKRRLLTVDYLPNALAVGLSLLALVLLSIDTLREALMGVHSALPTLVFLAVVAASVIGMRFLRKALVAKAQEKTWMRALDLPQLAGMRERGWFEINAGNGGLTRFVFAKKRIRQGLYTGTAKRVEQTGENA